MRKIASIIVMTTLVGCGSGTIESGELLEGSIQSQSDPLVVNTLRAIEKGQQRGDQIMIKEVNRVLQSYNIGSFFYQGQETIDNSYARMGDPDTDGPPNCPYVGEMVKQGSDTGPASCSFLANEAFEAAMLAMQQTVDPNQEIGEDFGDAEGIEQYRTWYATAVKSAIEITSIKLVGALRAQLVCDTNPTPAQSAFAKGKELGREIYIQAVNERLQELGIDFDYPNGPRATTSTRYCRATIRVPAKATAESRVLTATQAEPLCSAIGADPVEQSSMYHAYMGMSEEYRQGIVAGISDADVEAQNILQGGGACLGSPLVLDLAGDGIALGGEVAFDLRSDGLAVRTSWIGGDDALLTLDRNGNGLIDDGTELFGDDTAHANGFAKLAALDDNRDQRIDAGDAVFNQLRLWLDVNRDGVSQAAELFTLPAKRVKAIELRYNRSKHVDVHGNQFRQSGRFVRSDGSRGALVDVWFNYR